MNGEQLVLFNVYLYTVDPISPANTQEFDVQQVQSYEEWEQLELNLFPQQSHLIPRKLLILAA